MSASTSRLTSFSTSPSCRMPQCAVATCTGTGRHRSSTASSGTCARSARMPICTMPSSSKASLAASSLRAGRPNRITAGTPAACAAAARSTSESTERWYWPGIEAISSSPVPCRTNSGWIRSAGETRVSRTRSRTPAVRRRRRRRVTGKAMGAVYRRPCSGHGKGVVLPRVDGQRSDVDGPVGEPTVEEHPGHDDEYSNEALRKLGARVRHLRRKNGPDPAGALVRRVLLQLPGPASRPATAAPARACSWRSPAASA